jgi:hypothetical protein
LRERRQAPVPHRQLPPRLHIAATLLLSLLLVDGPLAAYGPSSRFAAFARSTTAEFPFSPELNLVPQRGYLKRRCHLSVPQEEFSPRPSVFPQKALG